MNPFTEIHVGKCPHCKDQLLSVAPRNLNLERRVICPFCTTNSLEDAMDRLRWKPTEEEQTRMAQ